MRSFHCSIVAMPEYEPSVDPSKPPDVELPPGFIWRFYPPIPWWRRWLGRLQGWTYTAGWSPGWEHPVVIQPYETVKFFVEHYQ